MIADTVASTVRARGERYFREDRVAIGHAREDGIDARVRGSRGFRVELAVAGDRLSGACDCPYFRVRREVCAHIWATILEAQLRALEAIHGEADERGDNGAGSLRFSPCLLRALGIDVDRLADRPGDDRPAPAEGGDSARDDRPQPHESAPIAKRVAEWKRRFDAIGAALAGAGTPPNRAPRREILYAIEPPESADEEWIDVEILVRVPATQRQPERWLPLDFGDTAAARDAGEADRRIITLLEEFDAGFDYFSDPFDLRRRVPAGLRLSRERFADVLPLLLETGRLHVRDPNQVSRLRPLRAAEEESQELQLRVEPDSKGRSWILHGVLRTPLEEIEIDDAWLFLPGGWWATGNRVHRLESPGQIRWAEALRGHGPIRIPRGEETELLERFHDLPAPPDIEWPPELQLARHHCAPQPALDISQPSEDRLSRRRLRVRPVFIYDGRAVRHDRISNTVPDAARRRLIVRCMETEKAHIERLLRLGLAAPPQYLVRKGVYGPADRLIHPRDLAELVRELSAEGWRIEAQGRVYRQSRGFELAVRSGVDWFDLEGHADFDGQRVAMPALLAALRRGEDSVLLDDGTLGVLPSTWLRSRGLLLSSAEAVAGALRFRRSQAALLDALVASEPQAKCDETFAKISAEIRSFRGIRPAEPTTRFRGALRDYQKEGLGWLGFLRRFGLGGCLADDMGLGKTVQVLAHLDSSIPAPRSRGKRLPSLVVVPRSLIFNWLQEASRFTPELRVLDHSGTAREKDPDHIASFDIVLTTYGTLVRDIELLRTIEFEHAILDEAQAIKNAATTYAKSVRLIRSRHRLALSGTPIENHLGELWSIIDFLNPGMLGSSTTFARLTRANAGLDEEAVSQLARALRPLILRRTKSAVARELPERVEQTILCELDAGHRRLYDELRGHYRARLSGVVEEKGLGRAKIQVLEALLRLRQAACHPGLVDPRRGGDSSAKLETLVRQLADVVEEGHKALVFSQFTRLLGIVKRLLDGDGIAYEYLDGKTRDRAARVARFQNDPACRVFLISLKAGGLGLNLTAAEYVFILDPWWNPAVEAQAIDRAHRIGQTRQVIAYRLIAKDTVETKVVELQERKRRLAEGIITADAGVLRELRAEDLELLLS